MKITLFCHFRNNRFLSFFKITQNLFTLNSFNFHNYNTIHTRTKELKLKYGKPKKSKIVKLQQKLGLGYGGLFSNDIQNKKFITKSIPCFRYSS